MLSLFESAVEAILRFTGCFVIGWACLWFLAVVLLEFWNFASDYYKERKTARDRGNTFPTIG